MKHLIIGTAGHVDHGKTVLVEKLTGTNTDRLKEEKDRGISIDLGFTFLTLNNGQRAGIVDVPGHERFIKNMLAGVGGIDMVMLVIAADEGVMPQTREHLDIIQLLQINKGVVVITKVDLVDDELLELVREDVREFLSLTILSTAPVCEVSSLTGQGLDELKEILTEIAETVTPRPETGFPRLPIDRVFSITGFGTVVTGTLVSGRLRVGDNIKIYPQEIASRIRSLQVHGEKKDYCGAGQRVAVNLTGIETGEINRGNVLAAPGTLKPWNRVDVKLHVLQSAPRPVKNRSRVRVYLGTGEILSRVVLLDREEALPGEDCYAQLITEELVACAKNDRFVIRSYSPMLTIGGGKVIDPTARKHKRLNSGVIQALKTREKGSPAELTEQFFDMRETLYSLNEIKPLADLEQKEKVTILDELVKENKIKKIPGDLPLFTSTKAYNKWAEQITSLLKQYHRQYPLREGYPKEEMRSRKYSRLTSKQFQQLLQAMEEDGYIKIHTQSLSLPSFQPAPSDRQAKIIAQISAGYKEAAYQPPGWAGLCKQLKLAEDLAGEILQYLLRQGILVKVAENIFFHRDTLESAQLKVKEFLKENHEMSLGQARDILKTSRKYALPLLEYFDSKKITRRVGDMRVAGKALNN